MRQPVRVVVYTRAGCGLCDAAERLVATESGRAQVVLLDVDGDPDLQRAYHVRVPVIEVNGQEIAEGQVQPGQVRRAVRAASRRFGRGGTRS